MDTCSRTARCSPICKNGFSASPPALGSKLAACGIAHRGLVFRVHADDIADHGLERRERGARQVLAPGLGVVRRS